MIELRWVALGKQRHLQYRSLKPTWQASGAWGEPSQWSEWEDVPTVDANGVAYEDLRAAGGIGDAP
jgi:hypothetical protein